MRVFGLIGYPLSHSFSPGYFSAKFRKESIDDAFYRSFELLNISEFSPLIRDQFELVGLNVTTPYKELVIPFLQELSPEATAVNAVNTIQIIRSTDGSTHLKGFNTDIVGFRQSIKPFLESKHDRALILGSGGAAKAVKWVLEELGIRSSFVSRTEKDGQITYADLQPALIASCPLIINCTPVGMHPKVKVMPPIPADFFTHISKDHFLIDLIYNPEETLFLKNAKTKGAMTLNGLSMLQQQAEASWKIWNS